MSTRKEQLGRTGGKMRFGEETNPTTDLPNFLNTNKATETRPQKGTVNPKGPESKGEDEATVLMNYVRELISQTPLGISEPLDFCKKINEIAKQTPPAGGLRFRAAFNANNQSFYFDFFRGEKNMYISFGPIPAEQVLNH